MIRTVQSPKCQAGCIVPVAKFYTKKKYRNLKPKTAKYFENTVT